jgi:hypothetical protein
MTSGLVITFLFYPVPQLAEQAHRVVIAYDRNEVIAARRAAGLAVNLDAAVEDKARSTSSLRITTPPPSERPVSPNSPQLSERVEQGSQSAQSHDPKQVDFYAVAGAALAEAAKSPDRLNKWGENSHGLSVASLPVREFDSRYQVVVFAVRNNKKNSLRILPGQPEIFVETVSSKGGLVTMDSVRKLATQTTAVDNLIPGGGIVYYAVVYEAPVLGAKQDLRIAVAQTSAADEPAFLSLNSPSRKGSSKKHGVE